MQKYPQVTIRLSHKHKDDGPLVLPYLPSYRVAGAISFASSVQLKYFKLLAAPTAIFFFFLSVSPA